MDATEKIARAHFDAEQRVVETDGDTDYDEKYAQVRSFHVEMACHLIAAFPQLALEGREEWGVLTTFGHVFYPRTNREEAEREHARFNLPVASRTVWESPWSEVRS